MTAPYDDPPSMVLLHPIGGRSGRPHSVPMRAQTDGDALYVFSSVHGSERHPALYHNLIAHPETTIEIGTESVAVRAVELSGEERETIFGRQAARFPIFADYQRRLARTIPVMRLDRRPA